MGDHTGMPPMGDHTGMPPMGDHTGMPPMGDHTGMPPMGNTSMQGEHHDGPSGMKGEKKGKGHHASPEDMAAAAAAALEAAAQMAEQDAARIEADRIAAEAAAAAVAAIRATAAARCKAISEPSDAYNDGAPYREGRMYSRDLEPACKAKLESCTNLADFAEEHDGACSNFRLSDSDFDAVTYSWDGCEGEAWSPSCNTASNTPPWLCDSENSTHGCRLYR
jgi:hypothetical protein